MKTRAIRLHAGKTLNLLATALALVGQSWSSGDAWPRFGCGLSSQKDKASMVLALHKHICLSPSFPLGDEPSQVFLSPTDVTRPPGTRNEGVMLRITRAPNCMFVALLPGVRRTNTPTHTLGLLFSLLVALMESAF